ncbi:response regulator transcription factor [Amnibacterium endophyticum]|uniref:Response regulator n=1 Tax=Amnibacterium endophyticum TaxID=2109337 RepID=A0ABW4LH86_9MICO
MTTRVVLADDQAMVRSGLALVLGAEGDIEVVAQCADGAEAVHAARRHRPDAVLMDVRMPGTDGPAAARRLRQDADAPPVLALTTFDDDEVLWSALDAGMQGFVLKDSPAESLIQAVRAVAAGAAWVDPRVLPRVLARARRRSEAAPARGLLERLTPREREVLDLMSGGANNAEIGERLRMGERTVKTHVSAILQKLEARDRIAAVLLALDAQP